MESNNLKVVYIFTDWYYPGFRAGGPIQSVYNLASLLSKNVLVKIVTRNTDYGSQTEFKDITANNWVTIAPNHQVMYLSKENLTFKSIKQIIKENKDKIIIFNGIFSFWFSILPLFIANFNQYHKIFISVRGMLHKSAMSIKPIKKLIFLAFARGIDLFKNVKFLASSEFEKIEILKFFPKSTIHVVSNIPLSPINTNEIDKKKWRSVNHSLRLTFLGRISPEKNPLGLLKALKLIKTNLQVQFVGACIDTIYKQQFESHLKDLPTNIVVNWKEEVPHHQLTSVFNETDVMVLPSLGENFGHSIFESFAHSVPVIIGNNTPWKNIKEKFAGIEINPNDTQELINAIQFFDSLDYNQFCLWTSGSHRLALNYFIDNNFEEQYFKVLDLNLSTK